MKKIAAALAAVAMSVGGFALGVGSAQAADVPKGHGSITVNGDISGHTFKAYQIGTVNSFSSTDGDAKFVDLRTVSGKEATVKSVAEAAAAEAGGVGSDKVTTMPQRYESLDDRANPVAWVTSWDKTADAKALRLFADKYAATDLGEPNYTLTAKEGEQSITFDLDNIQSHYGWYLITDTDAAGAKLGAPILVSSTLANVTTLNGETIGVATVKPEEPGPGPEPGDDEVAAPVKTVAEASTTVSENIPSTPGSKDEVGFLHYTVTGTLPKTIPAGYTYKFVDVPPTGMTITPQAMTAYVQDTNEDGSLKVDADGNPVYREMKKTAEYRPDSLQVVGDGTKTFTVSLWKPENLPAGAKVKITYLAWVTAEPTYNDAGIGEVSNSAHIEYGSDAKALKSTASASATVKVYKGFQFTKISAGTKQPLSGARFSLQKKGASTYAQPLRVITSADDGVIAFTGLAAGDYVVSELTVPSGYYNIRPTFEVTVNENGTVTFGRDATWDLVDNADQSHVTVANVNMVTQLPSTGGAGLAAIAAAIVLAATGGVFFAAKYTRNRRESLV